ncbi:Mu transposase C-terminal domain-containing protein [Falsirhodobacter xinxiangensis]|uniref:Mu transposase C-terminal domain-containing protein n=1 Tax=Falsirhodobacter xinxiangensis TaxID=2530049 RepID=UPI0010AAD812|nr:DDE-type integrase/transposase/recombinase [Rhodobacter xinxiangensis]
MNHPLVGPIDAVRIKGQVFAFIAADEAGGRLVPLGGSAEELHVTTDELNAILQSETAWIEHRYFGQGQARRRAVAGHQVLTTLPAAERDLIMWKVCCCEVFLAAERDGEVSRTDVSYAAFLPVYQLRVQEHSSRSANRSGGRAGDLLNHRKPPSLRSLLIWVRIWERHKDPLLLLKRSRYAGRNAARLGTHEDQVILSCLPNYLHPNRPSQSHVVQDVHAEVRRQNALRSIQGLPPLRMPSASSVRRRILTLSRFEVTASREGLAVAKERYGPVGRGLDVEVPLERVEMDEWKVDLISVLEAAGVEPTPDQRREMALGRYFLCVAIDCATRCVLGIKLADSASTPDALATLWLALIDKSEMARALGCRAGWHQSGHIAQIVVDNGSSFVSSEFKAAVADLGIGYDVMPAGVPKLRGRIERMMRTFAQNMMPFMTGRTFSNPVERGAYPSEAYAVHTAQDLVDAFVRYIVDHYHQREHQGLDYNSPAQVWEAAAKIYPVPPAPNRHVLRAILGLEVQRRSGRHGIQLMKLRYHSETLARHFERIGGEDMLLRVDPEDLGHISCWMDGAWHVLACTSADMRGVSVDSWTRAVLEAYQSNRSAARSGQILVDDAVLGLRATDEAARTRSRLGPINLRAEDLDRADRNLLLGVRFGDAQDEVADRRKLPGHAVMLKPSRAQEPPLPSDDGGDEVDWRFSDDQ